MLAAPFGRTALLDAQLFLVRWLVGWRSSWVAQRFQRCDRGVSLLRALGHEDFQMRISITLQSAVCSKLDGVL
jgi:hypothetical protein